MSSPQDDLTARDNPSDGDAEKTFVDEPEFEQPAVPKTIGPYRILRLLGEGGMGAVYVAEQSQPKRLVALKVIRAAFATPEMIRRFERESRALARLQHPGIAQIFEAGNAETPYGAQPFFAMELIHGRPLVRYAHEHKLNSRQRLELMIKVCDAVQHAHERGIIHRDLKPGNILVDETGQAKILDFGIARATDSDAPATRQTDMGQILGTLAYMSPEQVLADPLSLDTRSDVYALGVILYELLAHKMPYRLSNQLHEAIQTIRLTDPDKLSAIDRNYRGDVETIAAKALEKDKDRRYSSASGLAADIQRYLNDEPIVARPPSVAYQVSKFARRNKALVIGVTAVFIVLAAGGVVSTWEAISARRAQKEAEKQSAIARAVSDFLRNDLLGQASSYQQPDPKITVRTALDRAAQRIGGKFKGQPEVEIELHHTIGNTYGDLGLYKEEEQQMRLAYEMSQHVLGPDDPRRLQIMKGLIGAEDDLGNLPEAERLAQAGLRNLYWSKGDQKNVLWFQNALADIYDHESKLADAEALAKQAFETSRRVFGPENKQTLAAMQTLSTIYGNEGKSAEAESIMRRLFELQKRVMGLENQETLWSMSNLAMAYALEGKVEESEELNRECLAIRRRVLGPDHPDTVLTEMNLGDALMQERKYSEALPLLTGALNVLTKSLGPEADNTLLTRVSLAQLQEYMGNGEDALKTALPAARANSDDPNVLMPIAWIDLTVQPAGLRRLQDGLALARKAYQALPDNPDILDTLGLAEVRSSQWDAAMGTLRKAVQKETPPAHAKTMFLLAIAQHGQRDGDGANESFARAVNLAAKGKRIEPDVEIAWREAAEALGKPGPELHN